MKIEEFDRVKVAVGVSIVSDCPEQGLASATGTAIVDLKQSVDPESLQSQDIVESVCVLLVYLHNTSDFKH